ncbi:unnamed protein product [Mytilus coruscus]|uniref:Uncharacterized protein n=1 Tax=Mytilus coruscus TaxID=42192 RepID=A0A6J8DWZ6_MYTCO|nr:unnamed protein product [Mytilus coruscus]
MSIVKKIVSLKGPKWKASPKVKECIEKNKKAFYAWKQKDRPKNVENLEYQEMKKNKRELRNQIRKEDHTDKQNFFNNLMDKPDSKTFYRLIRRNKHKSIDTKSTLIKDENNGEVINPEEQSQIFADYYEKLAVPSNEEFLEENKYRLALMNNIIKHTIQESIITTFNEEEILIQEKHQMNTH